MAESDVERRGLWLAGVLIPVGVALLASGLATMPKIWSSVIVGIVMPAVAFMWESPHFSDSGLLGLLLRYQRILRHLLTPW